MSCDWEGNRRSGVALAMPHRLKWFIHPRAQGLSKGDEHPTNTLHGVWYTLPYHNFTAENMEKSQHTDFNEDKTNESVVWPVVMYTAVKAGHSGRMKKHVLRPLR